MAVVTGVELSGKVVIRHVGLMLSGDIDKPILDADTIVVVNHGRIAEQGLHADLMAVDNGLYQKLYLLQTLEE